MSDYLANGIELMRLLNPLSEPFQCDTGAVIFKQGMTAEYLYLIRSGRVDITFKPEDGGPITVSHVEPGGLFGWSAVIGSGQYTSSAIAIEPLEATRIRGDDIRRYCREHPEKAEVILEQLAASVSSRWQNADDQIRTLLAQIMRERN